MLSLWIVLFFQSVTKYIFFGLVTPHTTTVSKNTPFRNSSKQNYYVVDDDDADSIPESDDESDDDDDKDVVLIT